MCRERWSERTWELLPWDTEDSGNPLGINTRTSLFSLPGVRCLCSPWAKPYPKSWCRTAEDRYRDAQRWYSALAQSKDTSPCGLDFVWLWSKSVRGIIFCLRFRNFRLHPVMHEEHMIFKFLVLPLSLNLEPPLFLTTLAFKSTFYHYLTQWHTLSTHPGWGRVWGLWWGMTCPCLSHWAVW